MRTYGKRKCWVCGKILSASEGGWVRHQRKHVKEGFSEEYVDYDGHFQFKAIPPPEKAEKENA